MCSFEEAVGIAKYNHKYDHCANRETDWPMRAANRVFTKYV